LSGFNRNDIEDEEIGRFAEDTVNGIIKKISRLNVSKKPTKIKFSMEFGEDGPRFAYVARTVWGRAQGISAPFHKAKETRSAVHIDTIEHDTGITVLIELPIAQKQIGVEAIGSTMFLLFGSDKRTVTLPHEVDAQSAHAIINNNVLEVNLPYGKTDKITKIEMVDRDAKKSH
jgi:HSP20 family molecular chaperone IbpA